MTSTAKDSSSKRASVPRAIVTSSPHYCRPAHGVVAANGVRIMVSGIDLVRDENGAFRVLEDNVRIPSGVSYVIENRRAMTQNFSTLFGDYRVQPVDEYPSRLLNALRASAPPSIDDPVNVVLSPGVHNAAYFEHVLLARMMGVELVEGPDWLAFLRASGAMEAYMRSTSHLDDANAIAAFLLLDRIFPRSVLFSLYRAHPLVLELQPGHQCIAAVDHVRQGIAQARATLEFVDSSNVLAQLGELLELLELTCIGLDESITERFFYRDSVVNWHSEGAL
ncbi:MAG TPA: circularly permuted type 2 ATP-grasp protein [Acidimicrobiales bacterium]|nr:circularly permuted type 2 ATP-grasp protein [Acidimicrobiales bacterium]